MVVAAVKTTEESEKSHKSDVPMVHGASSGLGSLEHLSELNLDRSLSSSPHLFGTVFCEGKHSVHVGIPTPISHRTLTFDN